MGVSKMRSLSYVGLLCVVIVGIVFAGINWKAVWVEPKMPILLTVGQTKPYTIMGLNGGDVKADLTASPYLSISSSDPDIVQVDRNNAAFIGEKTGHAQIRISFGGATSIVQAFVREQKTLEKPQ
jgi:hypothetical protein